MADCGDVLSLGQAANPAIQRAHFDEFAGHYTLMGSSSTFLPKEISIFVEERRAGQPDGLNVFVVSEEALTSPVWRDAIGKWTDLDQTVKIKNVVNEYGQTETRHSAPTGLH